MNEPERVQMPIASFDMAFVDRCEPPVPESDEHLLALVQTHIDAERADIEGYRALCASRDPVVTELMQLLVEDEERHHALLLRLAARLEDDLYWERSADPLPSERGQVAPDARRMLARVREFIRHEHIGAHRLHELACEARDLRRPLASLLLETMVLDSQKHETVLWHIARRLEGAR